MLKNKILQKTEGSAKSSNRNERQTNNRGRDVKYRRDL